MRHLLMAGAALGLFAAPLRPAAGQTAQEPVAQIPFELHRNKILVPVWIGARGPYTFILDTGAPSSVLNSFRLAEALGATIERRVQVSGAGDGPAQPAGITTPVGMAVGQASLDASPLVVVDLADQLAAASGRVYDGILGRPLFNRYVVRMDFQRRLLELYDRSDYRAPAGAEVIPIRLEGGHPHFDTEVTLMSGERVRADVVIDTGARGALLLDAGEGTRVPIPVGAEEMVLGRGARGWVRGKVGVVAEVALGGVSARGVVTAFVPDALGATPGADGNLGVELLRRFAVTFDYAGGRMVLEPTPGLGDPWPLDLSGITLRAGGEDWSVLSIADVLPGSPAERAGIRTGDVIVRLDGIATSTLETLELRFRQPGALALDLDRAGTAVSARLVLPAPSR